MEPIRVNDAEASFRYLIKSEVALDLMKVHEDLSRELRESPPHPGLRLFHLVVLPGASVSGHELVATARFRRPLNPSEA